MRAIADCLLYGILDVGYISRDAAEETARLMVEGGVDILQIRAKSLPEREIVELAHRIRPITQADGVPLILNDYPNLVEEAGADGVHVGQDDCSVSEARAAAGSSKVIVGKSTHSLDQAVAAAGEDPDYIAFGPLFATPTKPDYHPTGLSEIRAVHEQVSLPIFCIGGIKLDNLPSVLVSGANRAVIVSGILQAPDIAAYARAAKAALKNPKS